MMPSTRRWASVWLSRVMCRLNPPVCEVRWICISFKSHLMAYINLPEGLPGIRGPMAFRPETAKPLNLLDEILLLNYNNVLTGGELELIGTFVSLCFDCFFCQNALGGLAQHYQQCDTVLVDVILHDAEHADLSSKMKALLGIAAAVHKGG